MGYVLKAVLSSAQHPEYGQITKKLSAMQAEFQGAKGHLKNMGLLFMGKATKEAEHTKSDTAHIVFTADTFKKPYSEFERTYEVSSDNKAFQSRMGGYSIYGASLDGVDPCLRMEGLMADEMGGKDGWKIEKCFLRQGFIIYSKTT
ncbi:MAG: DUF6674 family protein [Lachnospiraceae bacterium]